MPTTPSVTSTATPSVGQALAQLLRIAIGATVYLVTLPLTYAVATFALAAMVFHYVVDRGSVRITGYQASAGSDYVSGLPPDCSVEPLKTVALASYGEALEMPQAGDADTALLGGAALALMALTLAIGVRLRRRAEQN